MKYIFAGDREISVTILEWLITLGYKPSALFISNRLNASHADQLIKLSDLPETLIFEGNSCNDEQTIQIINDLNIDYIFGIHFPYIIKKSLLELPKVGVLNLHPAYLPYNKGWHTPTWAILDGTPYGATLHFMTEGLDEGDIIHQKQIEISPSDTANSIYQKTLLLEVNVFKEAFPKILTLNPERISQHKNGTSHLKKELSLIQALTDTEKSVINKLRALTTNQITEGAYFTEDGKKYYVNVSIHESI
jgi:methionyl-tRNA formyltransferase